MGARKVILLNVNGLGLSTSSSANVLATAQPKSFFCALNKYRVLKLSPVIGGADEPDIFGSYEALATGQNLENSESRDLALLSNKKLDILFSQAKRHNSKLHLFGTLSKNPEIDIERLDQILKAAAANNIERIVLHLVIASSFPTAIALEKTLDRFLSVVNGHHALSLGTVSGASIFQSTPGISALFEGNSRRNNSSISMLIKQSSKKLNGNFSLLPLTFIDHEKNARISDFDSLLIFSSDIQLFSDFLYLVSPVASESNQGLPCFLKSAVFADPESALKLPVDILIKKLVDPKNTLFKKMRDIGVRTLIISESSKRQLFSDAGLSQSCAGQCYINYPEKIERYGRDYSKIIKRFSELIDQKMSGEYEFIFIDLPLFENLSYCADFQTIREALMTFDQFFGQLCEKTLKSDAVLIFSSLFGMIERLSAKERLSETDKGYLRTTNLVPMIIISKDTVSPKVSSLDLSRPDGSISIIFDECLKLIQGKVI